MDLQISTEDDCRLRARYLAPSGPARGAALLCPPHPAAGATMDVWLLPAIANRLAEAGFASLRLNFRGVDGSTGTHRYGEVEHRDAAAGLAWLRHRHEGRPLAAIGWSFGATMTARLGEDVELWVGIAPPTGPTDPDIPIRGPLVPEVLPPRRVVVVGELDQFFPPDTVGIFRPDAVTVVPGADHFFFDRDPEVAEAVVDAVTARLAGWVG